MATATFATHWSLSGPDRLMAKLIRTIAALGKRSNGIGSKEYAAWVPADQLAKPNGWKPVKLARAIREAESAGFVQCRTRDNGRVQVNLTKLSAGVFGLGLEELDPSPFEFSGDGPSHVGLVQVVASMASACPLAESLAMRLGRDVEDVWAELGAAEREGLVSLWPDHPAGPSVTLSALSAGRLGLRLASDGSRWIGVGQPDPTCVDAPLGMPTETDATGDDDRTRRFDLIADPVALGGLDVMIGDEAASRQCRAVEVEPIEQPSTPVTTRSGWDREADVIEDARFPRPILILGLRRIWPVMTPGSDPPRVWTPGDGPCPECMAVVGQSGPGLLDHCQCDGQRLGVATLCIVCNRSGVDHLLPRVEPILSPCKPRPDDGLKGGI